MFYFLQNVENGLMGLYYNALQDKSDNQNIINTVNYKTINSLSAILWKL